MNARHAQCTQGSTGIDAVDRMARWIRHLPSRFRERLWWHGECEPYPCARALSGINADGTPMQWVMTGRRTGWRARVLFDPGTDAPDPISRYQFARLNAKSCLAREPYAVGNRGQAVLDDLLHALGPTAAYPVERFTRGVCWLAVASDKAGVAMYIDASVRAPDTQWRIMEAYLRDCIHACPADQLLPQWRQTGLLTPASVGAEISPDGLHRFKIHWRLQRAPAAGELAHITPLLASTAVLKGLETLIGRQALVADDVLLETCFSPGIAVVTDAKLDVPARSVERDHWRAVAQCAMDLGVAIPVAEVRHALANMRLSYAGVGRNVKGEARLNLYFNPGQSPTPAEEVA